MDHFKLILAPLIYRAMALFFHLQERLCLDDFDEEDSDGVRHLELLGGDFIGEDHRYLVGQDQVGGDLELSGFDSVQLILVLIRPPRKRPKRT